MSLPTFAFPSPDWRIAAAGAGPHRDGWGIAFYEGRPRALFPRYRTCCEIQMARFLGAHPIKSRAVIAHIRQANAARSRSPTPIRFRGNYGAGSGLSPITASCAASESLPLDFYAPIGATDSEHAFCWMLDQLRARFESLPSPKEARPRNCRAKRRWRSMGVFNMLLSDGRSLYAYCGKKLSCLTRRAPSAGDADRRRPLGEFRQGDRAERLRHRGRHGTADRGRNLDPHQAGNAAGAARGPDRQFALFRTAGKNGERSRNMLIAGEKRTAIWPDPEGAGVLHPRPDAAAACVETVLLRNLEDAARAIKDMQVRGAPLIGVAAAYGLALALRADASRRGAGCRLRNSARDAADGGQSRLGARRRCGSSWRNLPPDGARARPSPAPAIWRRRTWPAMRRSATTASRLIADRRRKSAPANRCASSPIATPAGWRPSIGARPPRRSTRPMTAGIRPACLRRRDAAAQPGRLADRLRAGPAGRAARVIVDNAGGHLMQHGEVDLVHRRHRPHAANGDVCNKIGTYLKALAAKDNGVPFYVAAPVSTFDFALGPRQPDPHRGARAGRGDPHFRRGRQWRSGEGARGAENDAGAQPRL